MTKQLSGLSEDDEARANQGRNQPDAIRVRRRRDVVFASGLLLVAAFALVAILAPWMAPFGYAQVDFSHTWQPPGPTHLFGTDGLGRDQLSRVLYGARISFMVGIISQVIVVLIGLPLGAVAGYRGGATDLMLMRATDVMLAFPALLFMILLMTVLGSGLPSMIVAIGITRWALLARIVRGVFLALRASEYVEAATAIGASDWRIIRRHLFPNALGAVIVQITFGVPFAILSEAGLSFIGIGVNPPTPSWGVLIRTGFDAIRSQPYLALYPSLALAFSMIGFVVIGNGLRDRLDPKLRGA